MKGESDNSAGGTTLKMPTQENTAKIAKNSRTDRNHEFETLLFQKKTNQKLIHLTKKQPPAPKNEVIKGKKVQLRHNARSTLRRKNEEADVDAGTDNADQEEEAEDVRNLETTPRTTLRRRKQATQRKTGREKKRVS